MRLDPQVLRMSLKKLLLLERDPEAGEPLHGAPIGWRKLVVGDRDWRVIWRVTHDEGGTVIVDVAEVWALGARSDSAVYAEMTERVQSLPPSPNTLALADVVQRLGRAAGTFALTPQPQPTPTPLPPWLVQRLTQQAGLPSEQVEAMSLEQAVDAWTAWSSAPRSS